jgi:hypothetical protein
MVFVSSLFMGMLIDMIGQKVGRLRIIKRMPSDKRRATMWQCKCDCGKETIARGASLRRGGIRSCGCFQRDQASKYGKKSPYLWMLAVIKDKAKKKGWMSELSYDDLLAFVKIRKCHYCDNDIVWLEHRSKNGIPTSLAYHLDRIDNAKTYSKKNCVVCCSICNKVKSNCFTYDEMIELGKVIRHLRERRGLTA